MVEYWELILATLSLVFAIFYRVMWKRCDRERIMYIQDFRDSQDNLATAIAEYEILKEAYLNLFCIEPGCNNIKYHTFNYCTSHVDHQAMSGTKNVSANKDEPKNMFVKND